MFEDCCDIIIKVGSVILGCFLIVGIVVFMIGGFN